MPWFGMDIGGTLAKLVYFEPTDGKTGKFLNQIVSFEKFTFSRILFENAQNKIQIRNIKF